MNAHIITIGDEILIGQTLNTNAAFIGDKLSAMSIKVVKSSVVADQIADIKNEFEIASQNADLIIATGGLGPTHDDKTRDAVVEYFKTSLIKNENVLSDISTRFKKLKREMSKVNETQAMVPKNAEVIRNSFGTAPGYWIEKGKKIFVVMPGVPFEMKMMMDNFVLPKLEEKVESDFYLVRRTFMTTGIAESTLFEKLGNLDELLNGAELAFLPSQFGVKLRVTVSDKNEKSANEKLIEIEQKLRALAGRYIYGKDEEVLSEVVIRMLKERTLRVALAESCTGGLVSSAITNHGGSSEVFDRGIVAYSNAAKVEILKVNEDTLAQYGAVSVEIARQMAEGVKAISGADIGLSITGIMGPTGGSKEKPVGTVFVGYCDTRVCTAKEFHFSDDRVMNKEKTTQAALDFLRKSLLGIPLD